jgi:short chain dehydrogenase
MSASQPQIRIEKAWHHHLTIDLLLKVANRTFLHPFIAWLIPLCMRAQATPWHFRSMRVAIGYAIFITTLTILQYISQRIANGLPREVNLEEEVVVITGGASGLGLLIAEVYGMRGVSVAVLDTKEMKDDEIRGVEFYKCDVGDSSQVQEVAKRIKEDVSISPSSEWIRTIRARY